jgi:hypothetical protein
MKKIVVLLLIFISFQSFSQEDKHWHIFPVWTYHQHDATIYGVSLGLYTGQKTPRYTYTNGLRLELIGTGFSRNILRGRSPIVKNGNRYRYLCRKPLSEKVNGLNISLLGGMSHMTVNGISIGGLAQFNHRMNGISISGLMNLAQSHNGIQISTYNKVYRFSGLQFGINNNTVSGTGLQIGLLNNAKDMRGIQIGLWNKNKKRSLPIFNWQFRK